MRIAVNTRLLLPQLEGIGRFKHEVLQRLVAARPNDQFLFLFDRPFDAQYVYGSQVTAWHLPPPARHSSLWYLWFEWVIPWALRRWQADVFLSMDGYCSLRSKVPTVMVTHDIAHVHYPDQIPAWALRYYNRNVPRFLERAEQVVTVSEFSRQDIHQHYGTPLEKITVACNAAHERFQPLSAEEKLKVKAQYSAGQDYFFYVGAVHPRKNVERLLLAFDRFKQQTGASTKLLIGGRLAWQNTALQKTYDSLTHQADVEFLGYLSDEDLPRVLGAALALTYVSLFEGFGVPILEAMQAEVPVLTSNVSSLPEVAGEAAVLVDPESTEHMAHGMTQLFYDSYLRDQLIKAGLVRAKVFNWENSAKEIQRLIRKVS